MTLEPIQMVTRDVLTELDRLEKLRRLRTWCVALGVIALALAVGAMGTGFTNPKWSSNAYVVLGVAGDLLWIVVPLLVAGAVSLAIGVIASIVIAKRSADGL